MTITAFKNTKNNVSVALANAALAGDVTWTVAAGQGGQYPPTPFYVSCDSEVALCIARAADVLTVTRGQDGTAAAAHSAGALVELRPIAGLFLDLATAVNALEAGNSGTTRAQRLVNGGLEVWQRGNGPFVGLNTYTADRWYIGLGGTSTMSVSRDATNQDVGSQACAAVTYTHAVGGQGFLWQKLEDFTQLRGKPASFTARIRTNVANAVRLVLYDTVAGFQYGAFHTGDGTYQTLSVTGTWSATAPAIFVGVEMEGASSTVYVDNAMLVSGSVPADYVPLTPSDDWDRCLRYYQRWGSNPGSIAAGTVSATSGNFILPLQARMGGTPTLTTSAQTDWQHTIVGLGNYPTTVVGLGAGGLGQVANLSTVATTTGSREAALFSGANANAWLALEWNP